MWLFLLFVLHLVLTVGVVRHLLSSMVVVVVVAAARAVVGVAAEVVVERQRRCLATMISVSVRYLPAMVWGAVVAPAARAVDHHLGRHRDHRGLHLHRRHLVLIAVLQAAVAAVVKTSVLHNDIVCSI